MSLLLVFPLGGHPAYIYLKKELVRVKRRFDPISTPVTRAMPRLAQPDAPDVSHHIMNHAGASESVLPVLGALLRGTR